MMPFLGSGRNGWSLPHLQIAAAAVFVVALVSSVLLFVLRKPKMKHDSAIYTYFKFFYASFVKPHESHGQGDQQRALESFYKTQVLTAIITTFLSPSDLYIYVNSLCNRPRYTMQPENDSFEGAKIC